MKMTFRWYGSQMDPIPLRYIRQIPNMSGVVTSLMDMPAGALWPTERIQAMKEEVNAAGQAGPAQPGRVHRQLPGDGAPAGPGGRKGDLLQLHAGL